MLGIYILLLQFHFLNGYRKPPADEWHEAYGEPFASPNYPQVWLYPPVETNNVHQTNEPIGDDQNYYKSLHPSHGSSSEFGSSTSHDLAPLPDQPTHEQHIFPEWSLHPLPAAYEHHEETWPYGNRFILSDELQNVDPTSPSHWSTIAPHSNNPHGQPPLPDELMHEQDFHPESSVLQAKAADEHRQETENNGNQFISPDTDPMPWSHHSKADSQEHVRATSSHSHFSDSSSSEPSFHLPHIDLSQFEWIYTLNDAPFRRLNALKPQSESRESYPRAEIQAWEKLVNEVCKRNLTLLLRLREFNFKTYVIPTDIHEQHNKLFNWLAQQQPPSNSQAGMANYSQNSLGRTIIDHITTVVKGHGEEKKPWTLSSSLSLSGLEQTKVTTPQAILTRDAILILGHYYKRTNMTKWMMFFE